MTMGDVAREMHEEMDRKIIEDCCRLQDLERKSRFFPSIGRPIPIDPCLIGKQVTTSVTWWGWSQWYKFRWHGDHIDLGPLSVYGIPAEGPGQWFWRTVSILVKPLRWAYHRYKAPE